jgi:hypothetical protein
MVEVRREDGELCGHVAPLDGRWRSQTTFGAVLGEHHDEEEARAHVLAVGLAVLADRWTLVDGSTGEEQVVCIQQLDATEVTLALDVFSMPGVPTTTIPIADLDAGRWRLEHRS